MKPLVRVGNNDIFSGLYNRFLLPRAALRRALKTSLAILIAFLFWVAFVTIWLPLFLYRLFIRNILKPLIRPNFSGILTPESSIMAASDAIYSCPQGGFVLQFVLDGNVSKADITCRLECAFGQSKFRELSQRLEKWMGFYFWSPINDFRLEDLLHYPKEEENETNIRKMDHEEMSRYHSTLVNLRFKEHLPLWECIVIKNKISDRVQTHLFFRVHQALADGGTFLNIFDELRMTPANDTLTKALKNVSKGTSWIKKVRYLFFVCGFGPFSLAMEYLLESPSTSTIKTTRIDDSKQKTKQLVRFEKLDNFVEEKEIHLEDVKAVASSAFAPLGLYVVAIVVGAVRQIFINSKESIRLAKPFTINLQFDNPRVTRQLCNNSVHIPAPVEFGDKDVSPKERVGEVISSLMVTNNAKSPFCVLLTLLTGCLPTILIPKLSNMLPLGKVIVNFYPVSHGQRKMLECNVLDIKVKSGCNSFLGGAWATINTISYKGKLALSITAPKELGMGHNISKQFARDKENEVDELNFSCVDNICQTMVCGVNYKK